jgi:DNA modification methylase
MTSQNQTTNYDRLDETLKTLKGTEIGKTTVLHADCLDVLSQLPDNCIDSCVIDGPYGIGFMGKEWDNFKPKAVQKATRNYQPGLDHKLQSARTASMFAGNYDFSRMGGIRYQQFSYEWACELFRILKPGGYLISFCSPRMYHRMVTGIEDAGFQIRDQLLWIFSQNFPKSRSLSNDMDKIHGTKGKSIGIKVCSAKGIKDAEQRTGASAGCYGNPKTLDLFEPGCPDAQKWEGWKTALKSSHEPMVLAQKPISEKSIARNVMKWGTGGLNIDECRVGSNGGAQASCNDHPHKGHSSLDGNNKDDKVKPANKGRYPSNVILSEEASQLLGDKAKFFYCPKISQHERHAGCEHVKAVHRDTRKARTYNDRCAICGKKFVGSDRSRCHCSVGKKQTHKVARKGNIHPTVKPVTLLQHIVKLITPKDGICIDFFGGSGTTAIACTNLGIQCILVEKELEYVEIAKARIQYWHSKQVHPKNVA